MKVALIAVIAGLGATAWAAAPEPKVVVQHAWTGCVPCLEADVAAGGNLDAQDGSGGTALIAALSNQQLDTAHWLIDRGANPRLGRFDGFTPAHYAVRFPDLLKLLHDRGADVFALAQGGQTPLLAAIAYGNLRSVAWLMDRGASPAERDDKGRNGLHTAADYSNSVRLVEQLANYRDANRPDWVNDSDNDGDTPLMKSVRSGRPPLADVLLALGARLDTVNLKGRNLAHLALESRNPKMWSWVQQRGVDLNLRDKSSLSPLELAAQTAATGMLALLLGDASLDLRAPDGRSLLHHAVEGGRLENARLLLDRQPALIDAADNQGNSAAMFAAQGGRIEMLQLLGARGADLHRSNRNGATALTLAVGAKQAEVVDWLTRQP